MSTSLNESAAGRAATLGATASLDGFRVLLVEDSWIIAQSYAALLEPVGVQVVGPAASVSEASRFAAESSIDAAMVDMDLRGELATSVIKQLSVKGVPVIVVTGFEQLPDLGAPVELVLKKPIRAERLLKALRKLAADRA